MAKDDAPRILSALVGSGIMSRDARTPALFILAVLVLIGLNWLRNVGMGLEAGMIVVVLLPAAAVGLLAGVLKERFSWAPVLVGSFSILAYAVILVLVYLDVRSADDYEGMAVLGFMIIAILLGVAVGVVLLGIWAGARVSRLFDDGSDGRRPPADPEDKRAATKAIPTDSIEAPPDET